MNLTSAKFRRREHEVICAAFVRKKELGSHHCPPPPPPSSFCVGSRLRIGKLTQYSITYLRHLRDFFGTYFRLKPDPQTSTVRATETNERQRFHEDTLRTPALDDRYMYFLS